MNIKTRSVKSVNTTKKALRAFGKARANSIEGGGT